MPNLADPTEGVKAALRHLAARHRALSREIDDAYAELKALLIEARPELLAIHGVGVETAAQLVVTCGDNPERLRSQASFAALCGASPVPDKGYQGAEATVVITPYKGKNKPEAQKRADRSHAKLRGPGERANAQLKTWRTLRKLRCSPTKAGHLVKAIAVLQNHRVAQAARG